jgi:hypothetical protein
MLVLGVIAWTYDPYDHALVYQECLKNLMRESSQFYELSRFFDFSVSGIEEPGRCRPGSIFSFYVCQLLLSLSDKRNPD